RRGAAAHRQGRDAREIRRRHGKHEGLRHRRLLHRLLADQPCRLEVRRHDDHRARRKVPALSAGYCGILRAEVVKTMARPPGRLACSPSTTGGLAGASALQVMTKFAPEPPRSSLRAMKSSCVPIGPITLGFWMYSLSFLPSVS